MNVTTHVAMLLAILSGWFLALAASARFLPMSSEFLAIGPEHRIVENLGPEARILRTGSHMVVVNMTGGEAGKSLYADGAWIVLPALANGCLAFRKR
ncbi:MAG: hypothetical protein VR78_00440 [Hoeflea sp. BRH_c9]|nr:MAG: hypothetical protein VR78_00440 [Hoeflea sp. BRH_c9]